MLNETLQTVHAFFYVEWTSSLGPVSSALARSWRILARLVLPWHSFSDRFKVCRRFRVIEQSAVTEKSTAAEGLGLGTSGSPRAHGNHSVVASRLRS